MCGHPSHWLRSSLKGAGTISIYHWTNVFHAIWFNTLNCWIKLNQKLFAKNKEGEPPTMFRVLLWLLQIQLWDKISTLMETTFKAEEKQYIVIYLLASSIISFVCYMRGAAKLNVYVSRNCESELGRSVKYSSLCLTLCLFISCFLFQTPLCLGERILLF